MCNFRNIQSQFLVPFGKLGMRKHEDGTVEYGHAPEIAQQAYMVQLFSPLTDVELQKLEEQLKIQIPMQYYCFLSKESNGLILFMGYCSLYGYIRCIDRSSNSIPQPFPIDVPNVYEKPKNSKDSYFFIGGYRYDGSKLYIDKLTGKVHYCKRRDATSLYCWDSFEDMLISEIPRILSLFDEKGKLKCPASNTLPA